MVPTGLGFVVQKKSLLKNKSFSPFKHSRLKAPLEIIAPHSSQTKGKTCHGSDAETRYTGVTRQLT